MPAYIDWDAVDGPSGFGYTYTLEYCWYMGMIGDRLCVIAVQAAYT